MTEKTSQPSDLDYFAKKRLNQSKRLRLINLAVSRFVAHDLREKEKKAYVALRDVLDDQAAKIPASEIKALKKYGRVREITRICMPKSIRMRVGTKSFDVDGRIVERPDMKTVHFGRPADCSVKAFSGYDFVADFLNSDPFGGYSNRAFYGNSSDDRYIDAPLKHAVPGSVDSNILYVPDTFWVDEKDEAKRKRNAANEIWHEWIGERGKRAVEAVFLANSERIVAEDGLLRAACKMIVNANTLGDVLDIWPEAADIAEDLFGVRPIINTALVALNDDDLSLLCNNMGQRGVASATCAAKLGVPPAAE